MVLWDIGTNKFRESFTQRLFSMAVRGILDFKIQCKV
ncbi:MAG: hypothetical protein METHAR1v1_1370004 [Methanothrix sp.]|nr:MAG: hypothetical protein METHAR1v1_1370004 [Methanothrix sp.]